MRRGTLSLLVGVHQFGWPPLVVLLAWWRLYGRPSWREVVCIAIHDIGYWGKARMDDADGEEHPEVGARIAAATRGTLTPLDRRRWAIRPIDAAISDLPICSVCGLNTAAAQVELGNLEVRIVGVGNSGIIDANEFTSRVRVTAKVCGACSAAALEANHARTRGRETTNAQD